MKTVEERLTKLEAGPIAGNHYQDANAFEEMHDIIMDPSATTEQKLRALAFGNALTGEDDPVNEAALVQYIEYCD